MRDIFLGKKKKKKYIYIYIYILYHINSKDCISPKKKNSKDGIKSN